MPALFIGHGSPMNAIEDNAYSRSWTEIAHEIPRPEAILAVSAHWYTDGSRITDAAQPRMVYDMYGFPDELYQLEYRAKGAPALAHLTKDLISSDVQVDNGWGLDHGTWSVLHRMYPEADIPVIQLSIDSNIGAEAHFNIGREIHILRDQGVLLLGSGNVVHNLARVNWAMDGGYPWAEEFDGYISHRIKQRQYADVLNYKNAGVSARDAFITPEHYYPLLYVLGASQESDNLRIFNDACTMGSLSMTCYLFE
jgi:4,5-DOPA dioxygenase extradiol